MVPYSYTSVRPDIGRNNKTYDYQSLMRLDKVDLTNMDNVNELFDDYLSKYRKLWIQNSDDIKKFMFKEFSIIYDHKFHFVYYISNWNKKDKESGEDTRTITMSVYKVRPDNTISDIYMSFKCKLAHLYQIYLDIKMRLENTDLFKEYMTIPGAASYNLYVIPVYFCHDRTRYNYARISALMGLGYDKDIVIEICKCLNKAISMLLSVNYFVYESMEENKIINDKEVVVKEKADRSSVYPKSDKHESKKIKLVPDKYTKYIRYNGSPVSIKVYSEQVRGHHKNVWCGSEKDGSRHKERIWVDPYIRGANKDARIIREYS